jgi:hypothetical protein
MKNEFTLVSKEPFRKNRSCSRSEKNCFAAPELQKAALF